MNQTPIATILAGGLSTRMGTDKSALRYKNRTFLEIVIDAAQTAGLEVVVIGRIGLSEIECHPDDYPEKGPLGGIVTGLRYAKDRPILVLPVDSPLIDADVVLWLLEAWKMQPSNTSGLTTRLDNRIQPLFALYHPQLLNAARSQLTAGNLSVTYWVNQLGIAIYRSSTSDSRADVKY